MNLSQRGELRCHSNKENCYLCGVFIHARTHNSFLLLFHLTFINTQFTYVISTNVQSIIVAPTINSKINLFKKNRFLNCFQTQIEFIQTKITLQKLC